MLSNNDSDAHPPIAFIGGGNMASAIIGGLLGQGMPPTSMNVVEPTQQARAQLLSRFGITAQPQAGPALSRAELVLWAVKPQMFRQAAGEARAYIGDALHLSVAAGINTGSIAVWVGTQRVVRAMPNTPALIGKGISALFANAAVAQHDRDFAERVIATTGKFLWVDQEAQLDAVTALSGSGPAYVFFFLEAMQQAGTEMGLTPQQAYDLSVETFAGACDLARASADPPDVLRRNVTSAGGTTFAAITSMEQDDVKARFIRALHAARKRAAELGDEFGA